MKHILTCIFLLTHLAASTQSGLKFTEYMPSSGQAAPGFAGESFPWIEVQNTGHLPVETENYKIRILREGISTTLPLPAKTLLPGQTAIFWFQQNGQLISPSVSLPVEIQTGSETIYLLDPLENMEDSLAPVNPVKENEVWVRNSISGKWAIFPGHFASPGELNTLNANWNKIASSSGLPPADSEPNACLTYKGKIWVLGGWSYRENEQTFASASYLLQSEDGQNWNRITDSLPFTHYSSFVVFRDSVWVYTNYDIYCTVDGINWITRGRVPYEFFGSTAKVTVMDDKLYFADTALCGFSSDGIAFTIQPHHMPSRTSASLKALNGRLYYMGGQNLETGEYFNDVWSSSDGLHWTRLVTHAPWKARKWFMSEIYQHKIWVFGGFQLPANQADAYANMNDIWYSENGTDWHAYTPINPWPMRHAAYHTLKDNKIFMLAGYDNGEINGLLNDVWTFEIKNFYLKPGGNVNDLQAWSSTIGFDGPSPLNFDQELIHYHIKNPGNFILDTYFQGSNSTSTLVIGDGFGETSVEILPQSNHTIKTIVSQGSQLTIVNQQPLFGLQAQPHSHVVFTDCQKLDLPETNYADLTVLNSRLIDADTINVTGNFHYHQLSHPGGPSTDITVRLEGNLQIGERTGTGIFRILGTHNGDQHIFTHNHQPQSTGNMILIKPSGNFVVKDPLHIDQALQVMKSAD